MKNLIFKTKSSGRFVLGLVGAHEDTADQLAIIAETCSVHVEISPRELYETIVCETPLIKEGETFTFAGVEFE